MGKWIAMLGFSFGSILAMYITALSMPWGIAAWVAWYLAHNYFFELRKEKKDNE